MHYLGTSIVEAEAIPLWMFTTTATVEVLARIATEVAKTFKLVLYGMRMNDIHDDGKAHIVGIVDEVLQLVGSTETAGGCKEVRNVITERAIVWMLLDGHNLNGSVAKSCDTWQYIHAELFV